MPGNGFKLTLLFGYATIRTHWMLEFPRRFPYKSSVSRGDGTQGT